MSDDSDLVGMDPAGLPAAHRPRMLAT